jgi:hypothetical protein
LVGFHGGGGGAVGGGGEPALAVNALPSSKQAVASAARDWRMFFFTDIVRGTSC